MTDAYIQWDNVSVGETEDTTEQFVNGHSEPDVDNVEPNYDHPSPEFVKAGRRQKGAAAYERKVRDVLHVGMRFTLAHEATVPDGAALIQYGPALAHAMGDWAAEDKRIARGIDFITGGTATPAMAAIAAVAPLVLQVLRNHEPVAETPVKPVKIWRWTLPFKLRFRLRLGRLRPMTHEPDALREWVLNDKIRDALAKQGIHIAGAKNGSG